MAAALHHGDAVAWANAYDGPLFHALVCDPPYHLTQPRINTSFRIGTKNNPRTEEDKAIRRGGFMGARWDGGDLAFRAETWAAFLPLLYPGAFGMAFAGSRGWHRMAVAIEDAGFVIHPSMFGYAYGSGFPKATRVKDAPAFAGHRYGLQAIKPALEPIIVFQKPYGGRPVDAITTTGAGALWIDGARVPHNGRPSPCGADGYIHRTAGGVYDDVITTGETFDTTQGRWPANLLLSCCGLSPHAPDCPVEALGRQSGESKSTGGRIGNKDGGIAVPSGRWEKGDPGFGDTGTAARFFFHATADRLDDADPVFYTAKASRSERDAGLEGMPERSRDGAHGNHRTRLCTGCGMTDNGSNDHTRCGGEIVNRMALPTRNTHPTIKPLSLCRYLATLLLPPPEYGPRRLFVPFAGAGSECLGAMQAGWEHVEGVELEADHVSIGRARIAHWSGATRPAPAPVAVPAAPETLPLLAAMEAA